MKDYIVRTEFGSLYQHGAFNNRIYVKHLADDDSHLLIDSLICLAEKEYYTKILVKVKQNKVTLLLLKGFKLEAMVPLFYRNKEAVFYMSRFFESRAELHPDEISFFQEFPNLLLNKHVKPLTHDFQPVILNKAHLLSISALFKLVFMSYPFPVYDPQYIGETMDQDTIYFGIFYNDLLIAVSSCEIDIEGQNAEMTDFAVHPDFRGLGLANCLLIEMEKIMKQRSIFCLYTIARLREPAMNKTFLNLGYNYSGTLINNTQISGSIQSMNVLYKNIQG